MHRNGSEYEVKKEKETSAKIWEWLESNARGGGETNKQSARGGATHT